MRGNRWCVVRTVLISFKLTSLFCLPGTSSFVPQQTLQSFGNQQNAKELPPKLECRMYYSLGKALSAMTQSLVWTDPIVDIL